MEEGVHVFDSMRHTHDARAMTSTSRRWSAATLAAALAMCLVTTVACSPPGGGTPVGAAPPSGSSTSASGGATGGEPTAAQDDPPTVATLDTLERRYGARLGVYAVDTGTGRTVVHRDGERFAFASTAKALSAGLLLQRDPTSSLETRVRYTQADVLEYAPVAAKHVADGMTVRELLAAALQYSDNTAANLVVERLGGPAVVERGLRALGDTTTEVDRLEPDLNEATPGDVRDTTTPRAIAADLRTLLLGQPRPVLDAADTTLLRDWMLGNTTGDALIRAGVPTGWRVADKTGNAAYGTRNDIAVLWPPDGRAPVVLALLSERGRAGASSDDALLADATKVVVAALG